jgi:acetolactate decarboxylase
MKTPHVLLGSLLLALTTSGCMTASPKGHEHGVVTQVSTYDALGLGLYDGVTSLESLRPYGDFGLGTLHGWNGEIVLLDGKYYLIPADGVAQPVTDFSATTPFLEVTWFKEDDHRALPDSTSYDQLKQAPANFLPSLNAIYAVKLEGRFRHLKTRSMPPQTKPYKPMSELVKTQPTFEFTDIDGTMVGYWMPPSMKGVGLAGWHLHFITKDGRGGGHVLEFTTREAMLRLDQCLEFHWQIPGSADYQQAPFGAKP